MRRELVIPAVSRLTPRPNGKNRTIGLHLAKRGTTVPTVDSYYSDLWVQAIKEVLAEDGKPPLSADEENQVRADVSQMTATRRVQSTQPDHMGDKHERKEAQPN